MSRSNGSRFPNRPPMMLGRGGGRTGTMAPPARGPPPPSFRAPPGRGLPPDRMGRFGGRQPIVMGGTGERMPPLPGGRGVMRGRPMIGIYQNLTARGLQPALPPLGRRNPPPPPPPRHLGPALPIRGGPQLTVNHHHGGVGGRPPISPMMGQQQAAAAPQRFVGRGPLNPGRIPPPPPPPIGPPGQFPAHSVAAPNFAPAQAAPLPHLLQRPSFPNIGAPIVPPHTLASFHAAPAIATLPAATAATTVTPYTPDQIAAAWTEHKSPAGIPYYHNSITQQSSYEKPIQLAARNSSAMTMMRTVEESSTTTTKPATTTTTSAVERPWTEYTDSATGKSYYSNGIITTWEKPSSLFTTVGDAAVGGSTSTAATTSAAATTTTTATDDSTELRPSRKKQKTAEKQTESNFSSKDEAIAAFKGLLIAKDVAPSLKWNEAAKLYSTDGRWHACEAILTTGERKQALSEYQTKRANELRQLEREEKLRARQAFHHLLNEAVPKIPGFSAWNTRFEHVRDALAMDDRFHVVAKEATRESLFLDFCEDYRKREDRKKRNIKKEAQENFVTFLKAKEEQGVLTFASTWNSFLSALGEDEKSNEHFVVSPFMSDADRMLYFADFVIDLQSIEDDKRRRIRDARRRAEQAQRDAYRDLLNRLAVDSKLFPWSHWREMEVVIASDSSYGPLHDQAPGAPRDLFEEFVEEWHNRYRHDRLLLGKLMIRPTTQTQLVVNANTSYETFTKALLESASKSPELFSDAKSIIKNADPVSSARVYFHEMRTTHSNRTISRRGSALRHGNYDSSEDEGEIVEEGEVDEAEASSPEKNGEKSAAGGVTAESI